MEEEFYTVEDIQRILKIGRTKAYQLCNTKGFPSIRMGSVLRVSKEKFEKWVDNYSGKTFYM